MSPPFQYADVHNPYAMSIGDMLMRQGQIGADSSLRIAAIQGNAAEQSSNAWAHALENVGGSVAQALDPRTRMQLAALKAQQADAPMRAALQQQTLEEGQLKIEEMKRQQAARLAVAKAAADTPMNEDGTYDLAGIAQNVPGPYRTDAEPHLQVYGKINETRLGDRAKYAAEVRQQADQLQRIQQPDGSVDPVVLDGFLTTAQHLGVIRPEVADQLRKKATSDPGKASEVLAFFATPPKMENAAEGSAVRAMSGPNAGQIVPGSKVPDKPIVVNGQLVRPETAERIGEPVPPQLSPNEAETIRHNKATEEISRLSTGRMEAAQAETARHNRAMEQANNPFGGPGGLPAGGNGIHGDDFLKTLPPGQAEQVKALAEGRTPFPTGMSYAKLQPLIQMVSQYDPTFDAANYTTRSKARTDLLSPNGTGAKSINALNTALQHMGRLSDLIEKLDNSNVPLYNALANPLSRATGSTAATNFEAVQPQAMKEIERLWRGTGGSAGEIDQLKQSLGVNMGKQQQREALGQFAELVRGKLDAMTQQRDTVLGPAGAKIDVLYPQNQKILDKIEKMATPGGDKQAAKDRADGMVTMRAPTGESKRVPLDQVPHYQALGATVEQ